MQANKIIKQSVVKRALLMTNEALNNGRLLTKDELAFLAEAVEYAKQITWEEYDD